MKTPLKRISVALSKEDLKELDELGEYLGENRSQVIRRIISFYYLIHQTKVKEKENE